MHQDPPPPDKMLKAALLLYARENVRRIWRLREQKASLNQLMSAGSVGDDLFTQFTAAEQALEADIIETVNEANAYQTGWGSNIFQTATEMVHFDMQRQQLEQGAAQAAVGKARWETEKGGVQEMLSAKRAYVAKQLAERTRIEEEAKALAREKARQDLLKEA